MVARAKQTQSPADERWGFAFGVDGLVSAEEAMRQLAITTDRTLRSYKAQGFIRIGYRIPGRPKSGVVVCARSLRLHLSQCEK